MENKDQDSVVPNEGSGGVHAPTSMYASLETPTTALSLEEPSTAQSFITEQQGSRLRHFFRSSNSLFAVLVFLAIIIGASVAGVILMNKTRSAPKQMQAANRFNTISIPLEELLAGKDLSLSGVANVIINGALQANRGLLLAPSLQPSGAQAGQIYYDQATQQLAYYNGSNFVFLTGNQPGGVQSLGGATGQLTIGKGLTLTNNQLSATPLSNNGVLSVQGQSGEVTFTAGPGLVINGTTFSNAGVLGIEAGTPNVTVQTVNGIVTISVDAPVVGTGTVTSSGGTAGKVPVFTAAQNIEDSIISQAGLNVTISGDLSVVTGGLNLSNALTVSNGGTGATSFANNGLLVGQGTGAFGVVAPAGAGLCLISTAGLPAWGACPGSTGVTSLNGLNGALNIANASGAGSTITIDDASSIAKGLASFNSTNFSVASGTVNTIQNINTGATPTFAGLNTNNINPSAALTIGSTAQNLTLQGNATTTLTATNGANVTALTFVSPVSNVTYRLQTATAGTYDICTTVGNCVSSGAVTTPGGTANRLAKFTGSQIIGNSIIVDNGSNVDVGGTLSVSGGATITGDVAVNGGDITATGALNITPGGALTIGVIGQQLILQGNASSQLTATNGGFTTALAFQVPTANVTYTLPTATAGTYDICTTAGNCVGSGGGVTTSGGTTNRLAKFTGSQVINNSTISDNGTNVTTSVDLVIQGGDVTVGVAGSQTGSLNFAHNGSAFIGTILQGALTASRTYTLPDADGTICLTSGNCSGAGSPNTLQAAYDAGNTIATVSARDIAFTLADSVNDSNFTITAATGSTGYVAIVRADGAGSADPAQLLLIDNLDVNRLQPVGLKIQAAGGGMTTAIDASDPEIVTAINIGANDILGTTGNIDLTNFDVAGATGNITTSGTINGQTISSSASFTGTVAIAGNATLASDLAVNGGDITASGVLTVTSGGLLTIGASSQQLILQGNASTQLTATGGGFTTTVGFTGTPTGAVTYNFDRAAAAGTYTICTNTGNCSGSNGVTTPGGTPGTIAKFTGAQTIGDSLLSESGGVVTVNGNLNLISGNQYQVNGTQISSANLSNDANLAKLSASQLFTGNTVGFQNTVNSTNAFNIQNATGGRIVTIDTASGLLTLGMASVLDGKLVFNNVSNTNTVTIMPGTPSANRTLTLPNASGIICIDSGNCAGAGATLQTAYNFSVGGTNPKIKINSSLGGVDIQDADTPTGANLLNIRASNGAGLGSVLFGVGNTGQATIQNSINSTTAFRLLTAGGTTILTGDTTNGQILLGQANTLSGTIVFRNASNVNTVTLTTSTPTSNRSVNLPDADGTICLTSGNCSGSGSSSTLQAAYDAGNTITSTNARNLLFTLADSATDSNFLVDLQCDTSCGANGRFAVQDDGIDVLTVSPGGSVLLQNSVNSTAAFQVSNATGALLTVDTTNNAVVFGQNGLAGKIQLFEPTSGPDTATLQTATLTASRTLTIGDESGTICLQSSANCNFAATSGSANYIQNQNAISQVANFRINGTGRADVALQAPLLDTAVAGALGIGTTNATAINLQQNVTVASGKTVTIQGNTLIQPAADGIAFNVKSSLTNNQFTVDTANGRVGVALGASVNPTLQSTGIEIKGAIRLSGANGTFADIYTTPLGGSISTAINIANYDPGASAQLVALGLPAGANVNSRAVTLLDARAGAHQPTLAVISPDENQIGGFSWDGSNTTFLTKTSTNNMALQANSLNIITLQNISGVARLGVGNGTPGYALDVAGDTNISTGSAFKINGTNICTASGCTPAAGSSNYIQNTTIQQTANMSIMSAANNSTTVFIKNRSAQTADILHVETFAGSTLFNIDAFGGLYQSGQSTLNGTVGVGIGASSTEMLRILTASTSTLGLSVTGQSGQTADLFQLNTSAAANLLIVGPTGATTFKNSADLATAFRVLNASSVPQFVIDNTASRIYIGNPVADATGALLVLDAKNTSGDPTGTNGGMYYNSSLGKMRCYENNYWRDCLQSTRSGFFYSNELTTIDPDGTIAPAQSGTAAGSSGSVPGEAGHPGIIQQGTGTSSTGIAYFGSSDATGESILLGNGDAWRYQSVVRIPILSTGAQRFNYRIGFHDGGLADTDGINGCFFKYSDNINGGKWQGMCITNSVSSVCDTTIAPVANVWNKLDVIVNAAGTSTDFQVDGVSRCQVTSNIPTASNRQTTFNSVIAKLTGSTERVIELDYIEVQSIFASSR